MQKEDPDQARKLLEKSALPSIIIQMRKSLDLLSYYTCGPIEAHQWTVRKGTSCPQAAGTIHSDFEKTFINAELIKFLDLKNLQPPFSEKSLKSKGKISRVGKNYMVEDGDILTFNAAAAKSRA